METDILIIPSSSAPAIQFTGSAPGYSKLTVLSDGSLNYNSNMTIDNTGSFGYISASSGINLNNNVWITAYSSSYDELVNMFKVTGSNIEVGAPLNVGTIQLEEDTTNVGVIDMNLTDGGTGSYALQLNDQDILKIQGLSSGADDVRETIVDISGDIVVDGTVDGVYIYETSQSVSTRLTANEGDIDDLQADSSSFEIRISNEEVTSSALINDFDDVQSLGINDNVQFNAITASVIGVGLSNPTKTLEALGTFKVSVPEQDGCYQIWHIGDAVNLMLINTDTNNHILFDPSNKGYNVGIGTEITPKTLTVNGDISGSGTLDIDGIATFDGNIIQTTDGNRIYNSNYASGFAGSGWQIDRGVTHTGESSAEFDNLTVRGSFSVYELLIHQIRATNGSIWVSNTGKVSGSIEGTYTMSFDDGLNYGHPFAVNDIIKAQRWDATLQSVYQSIMQVTGMDNTASVYCDLLEGVPPTESYEYVRIGNTTDTDRQGSIYLTADDNNAPYIDVIDDVSTWQNVSQSDYIKVRLGKLTGITSDTFEALSGYGLYASGSAYLEGGINATEGAIGGFEISSTYIKDSDDNLILRSNGQITASNALLEGNITATTGEIGGWEIRDGDMYSGDSNNSVTMSTSQPAGHGFIINSNMLNTANYFLNDAGISKFYFGQSGRAYLDIQVGTGLNKLKIYGSGSVDHFIRIGDNPYYCDVVGYFPEPFLPDLLTGKGFYVDGAGNLLIGDSQGSRIQFGLLNNSVFISSSTFYLGSSTQYISGSNSHIEISSSQFYLDNQGNATFGGSLNAASGYFSGSVSASVGNIGGWTIGEHTLSTDNFEIGDSTQDYVLSSSNFQVDQQGNITASNAILSGSIYAAEGSIGGWNIDNNSINKSIDGKGIKLINTPILTALYIGSGSDTFDGTMCLSGNVDHQYILLNSLSSSFEFYVSGSICNGPTVLIDDSLAAYGAKSFPGIQLFDALLYLTGSNSIIMFNTTDESTWYIVQSEKYFQFSEGNADYSALTLSGSSIRTENLTIGGDSSTYFDSSEKLIVDGNISASGDIIVPNMTGGTGNNVVILADGQLKYDAIDSRVWDPSTLLDASGGSNTQIAVYDDNDDIVGSSDLTWGSTTLTVNGNIFQTTGDYLKTDKVRAIDGDGLALYDDGDNGIFIEDGGNVGIKNANPVCTLDVTGTISCSVEAVLGYIKIFDNYITTTGVDRIYISETIEVTGDITASGNIVASGDISSSGNIYANNFHTSQENVKITNQTNYDWTTIVPASNILLKAIIHETSGNAAGNIRIGTSEAGEQVVPEIAVGANATLIIDCDWEIDWDNPTTLHINSDSWGSGEIEVWIIMEELI